MSESFTESSNLISPKQSGFKPDDYFINQLQSITHEIYKSFGDCLEVRGIFLDISKAFDKVWNTRGSCANQNKMVFQERSIISSPIF